MEGQGQSGAVRWHIHVIFLYYASYADRNNYKLLKSQNYRRFLIDSETATHHTHFPPFDIAFRKIHTTAITHPHFQELIPNIACTLSPTKNLSTHTRAERKPSRPISASTCKSSTTKSCTKVTSEQMCLPYRT